MVPNGKSFNKILASDCMCERVKKKKKKLLTLESMPGSVHLQENNILLQSLGDKDTIQDEETKFGQSSETKSRSGSWGEGEGRGGGESPSIGV